MDFTETFGIQFESSAKYILKISAKSTDVNASKITKKVEKVTVLGCSFKCSEFVL